MVDVVDVNLIDGDWEPNGPVIVLDADFAQAALAEGELEDSIRKALGALEMSGRQVVVLRAA